MLLAEGRVAFCELSKLLLKAGFACRHLYQLIAVGLSLLPANDALQYVYPRIVYSPRQPTPAFSLGFDGRLMIDQHVCNMIHRIIGFCRDAALQGRRV